MPFGQEKKEEKKQKKHKTVRDYKQKQLYINESEPLQKELLQLISLCGHKQAKILGIICHDFLTRYGINLDTMTDKKLGEYIKIIEMQNETKISVFPQFNTEQPMITNVVGQPPVKEKPPVKKSEPISDNEFENLSNNDKAELDDALAMFEMNLNND